MAEDKICALCLCLICLIFFFNSVQIGFCSSNTFTCHQGKPAYLEFKNLLQPIAVPLSLWKAHLALIANFCGTPKFILYAYTQASLLKIWDLHFLHIYIYI